MSASTGAEQSPQTGGGGLWSQDEHDRYLEGLQLFPTGPWKCIADHVGTRSVRQVQTHAQKYHEKVARRLRGLRKERKKLLRPEHRIDDESLHLARELESERLSVASSVSGSSVSSRSTSHSMDVDSLSAVAMIPGGAPTPSYYFDQHHHQDNQYQEEYGRHVAHRRQYEHGEVYRSSSSAHFHEYEYLRGGSQQERGSESFARGSADYRYQVTDQQQQLQHHGRQHHARDSNEGTLAVAHRRGTDTPSFSDCMDYLIDFFGSKEYSDAAWYRQHARMR